MGKWGLVYIAADKNAFIHIHINTPKKKPLIWHYQKCKLWVARIMVKLSFNRWNAVVIDNIYKKKLRICNISRRYNLFYDIVTSQQYFIVIIIRVVAYPFFRIEWYAWLCLQICILILYDTAVENIRNAKIFFNRWLPILK